VNNNQTALRIAQTVLLLLAPLYAQNWAVHATIPFDFTADQQAFAAGRYCISTDGAATVRLTWADSPHKAEVITVLLRSASQATPRIIFHSYGERHFLAELWVGEPNLVRQVYASAAELDLARTTKQELTIVIATVVGPKQLRSKPQTGTQFWQQLQ